MAALAVLWGCNWPVMKLGVAELEPLTFRAASLPFAALGMLLIAHWSGDDVRIPREWWGRVVVLSMFNIAGWSGFVLFGVQQLPAGRSVILAYTMPIWATLIATFVLDEPLSRHKMLGLALGMAGMALLVGEEVRVIGSSPFGAAMILIAAFIWAVGTVLLRKWKPPIAQNALSGWMMLIGWVPLALAAPLFDAHPVASLARMSGAAWFAVLYNIFLSGTLANWAWFTLARSLPVAVSSLSSLPVPVAGVFAGMLFLGERPGLQEWLALGLVVVALFIVLFQPRRNEPPAAAPFAPEE